MKTGQINHTHQMLPTEHVFFLQPDNLNSKVAVCDTSSRRTPWKWVCGSLGAWEKIQIRIPHRRKMGAYVKLPYIGIVPSHLYTFFCLSPF